jgi:glyceraldehyde-3-phosphate dehydrogenase/erythrose-4-phosphate dehydrogenase
MTLKYRIQKVEQAVKQSAIGAVLLHEPADGDDRKAFDNAITEALNAGHQIVVHASGTVPNRRIAGVIYESDGFNAMMTMLAHTPATDGRSKNKLSQILAEAQGTTLPIIRTVRP